MDTEKGKQLSNHFPAPHTGWPLSTYPISIPSSHRKILFCTRGKLLPHPRLFKWRTTVLMLHIRQRVCKNPRGRRLWDVLCSSIWAADDPERRFCLYTGRFQKLNKHGLGSYVPVIHLLLRTMTLFLLAVLPWHLYSTSCLLTAKNRIKVLAKLRVFSHSISQEYIGCEDDEQNAFSHNILLW